jgi:hypothetical protein
MKTPTRFLIAALVLAVLSPAGIAHANSCTPVGVSTVADDGLSVTMNSITTAEKTGSLTLTISYTQKNSTSDKRLEEGSFKLFFKDGTSEPQYGGFNNFFPGDSRDRSYTWEYLKSKEILAISYNAGFFAQSIDPKKLNWVIPGQLCSIASTTPTPTSSRTPLLSPTPTPSSSNSASSKSVIALAGAAMSIDMANLRTDAANLALEAAAVLTVVKEEFRNFDDAVSSAVSEKKLSLLPAFDRAATDIRIDSYTSRVSSLELKKNALNSKEKEIMTSLSKYSKYKVLLDEVRKTRASNQSAINRYVEAASILKKMNPAMEEARTLILLASSTVSPTPKASSGGNKEATILCFKGKAKLQVTGRNPICPKGYKKK